MNDAGDGEQAHELVRLNARVDATRADAIRAHQGWIAADAALRTAIAERDRFVAFQALAAPPPPPAPAAPAPAAPPVPPAPAAPPPLEPVSGPPTRETSTRTVQNVLFVLGGLLLGTAAIAFTAVAWTTFGVAGRAAILGVVTLIALALPLVALMRKLRATAETFVAIGLLLVILDGYAAWSVNLANVQSIPSSRYTGLVLAVTAAVALTYRAFTRLVGPSFAALLTVQPVIFLVIEPAGPNAAGVSLMASAVAAVNATVLWRLLAAERPDSGKLPATRYALAGLGWVFYTVWIVTAGAVALVAEFASGSVTGRVQAGVATVVAAVVLVAGTLVARQRDLTRLAGATLVIAVAVAGGFLIVAVRPGHAYLLISALTAIIAAAVVASDLVMPEAVRPGPRIGAMVVAGTIGAVVALLSVAAAAVTIRDASLARTSSLTGEDSPFTWELPASVLLVALAWAITIPQWTRLIVVAGGVVAVLAAPGSLGLAWWAPAVVALAGAAVLVGLALVSRTARTAIPPAAGALVLAVDAVLTATARPGLTTLVLGGIVVLGLALAAVFQRRSRSAITEESGGGWQVALAATGLLAALLAVPPAVGSALSAVHVVPWWAARATVAAIGLVLVAVVLLKPPALRRTAFAAALAGAIIWPAAAVALGEPVNVYAAVSLLVVAAAMVCMGSTVDQNLVRAGGALAAVPGAVALVVVVFPAVATVAFAPYSWLTSIWSGQPGGVGLVPAGVSTAPVHATDAVALGGLALASATAAYALTRRWRSAVAGLGVGGPTAILVGLTVARAPWPAIPAVTLLLGLILVMATALLATSAWRAWIATTQGIVYIGAGVAASLGVEWATLTALGVVVVAGAVVGGLGRTVTWRVFGVLAAVAFAATEAGTAAASADLRVRDAAFVVLAVAILALFVGAWLRRATSRRPESTAAQAAAHAAAVVALGLTAGWWEYAAGVCAVWGIAVGLRALVPGPTRAGRAALAAVAAGYELLGWWLLLGNRGVTLIEAYTLPLAAVALLAGWAALRSRPELGSWVAYGPALAAAFLPSLAAIITTTGDPWRRLALGTGALAVVIAGSIAHRRAPVVVGGTTLILVALHELVLLWQRLPNWIPLLAGGVILVVLAITYERRLRDLSRLRASISRMT